MLAANISAVHSSCTLAWLTSAPRLSSSVASSTLPFLPAHISGAIIASSITHHRAPSAATTAHRMGALSPQVDGKEYLYHGNNAATVTKTTLDGEIVWRTDMTAACKPYPPHTHTTHTPQPPPPHAPTPTPTAARPARKL